MRTIIKIAKYKSKHGWNIEHLQNAVIKRLHRRWIFLESILGSRQGWAAARLFKKVSQDPESFISEAWQKLDTSFFLPQKDFEWIHQQLAIIFPDTHKATLGKAQLSRKHILDVRGSGPFAHGERIDWHRDPLSDYRWEANRFYTQYHPAPYPGGPDITLPWELSRCQHFVTLGQAYWFTGDEKFVGEFKEQLESWLEQNPWPWGVNWAGPMDIAIRAVNWLWAYALMHRSPGLSQSFHLRFFTALVQHGHHIRRNLERSNFLRTNHYLANLSGLLYLGILLPESSGARQWANFAIRELNKEILSQFYPDGSSFEASTSYHRLSTEMILSCRVLALHNGLDFSPEAVERLEKSVEFMLHMTRPDGTVPLIGDHDNGRLHRLKIWSEPLREWNDFRYLLAIGAVMFQRSDFAQAAGDQWEEAVWLYGKAALQQRELVLSQTTPKSTNQRTLEGKGYPDGGYYIIKNKSLHLLVRAGPNGQNGNGGHAHNDKLSIVVHLDNHNWLIDPGCYTYTRDYLARNYFRSTAAHNTVRVDGTEQNPIPENELFSLPDAAPITRYTFQVEAGSGIFDASHQGYAHLPSPVIHRRKVYAPEIGGWCLLVDKFTGSGQHTMEFFFQTGSNRIVVENNGLNVLEHPNDINTRFGIYQPPAGSFQRELFSTWHSPGYGVKHPANGLKIGLMLYLPAEVFTILCWGDVLQEFERDPGKISALILSHFNALEKLG
jgi:hypothetical protein